jgi:hypothetical protein
MSCVCLTLSSTLISFLVEYFKQFSYQLLLSRDSLRAEVLPAVAEKAQNDRESERAGDAGGRCSPGGDRGPRMNYNPPPKHHLFRRARRESPRVWCLCLRSTGPRFVRVTKYPFTRVRGDACPGRRVKSSWVWRLSSRLFQPSRNTLRASVGIVTVGWPQTVIKPP